MLSSPHQLFKKALQGHYAIGAFNISNLEVAQAVLWAAEKQSSPVIAQTSEGALTYAGLNVIQKIVETLSHDVQVPVVLHLDHGKSFVMAKRCIEAGYTSVMMDASTKSLEENIALTKQVVDYAHEAGVWVEGELGAILGKEGAVKLHGEATPDDFLTNPDQAAAFVEATGVDALAVSVGTIHGVFKGQEYIRFELLEAIQKAIPNTPLVLHGASGIPNEELKRAVALNVGKVNVDTELRIAFDSAVREFLKEKTEMVDPRDMLTAARAAVQKVVEDKMTTLGSVNQK